MTRRTRRALGAAIALFGVITVAQATAEESAQRAVDLPAVAETADGPIPMSEAVSRGMGCNFIEDTVTCYSTYKESATALRTSSDDAAATCAPMTLWNGANFTGASITITQQSIWINLGTRGFDNLTSSWAAGCVGGYLADGSGGAGTRIGLPANGTSPTLGSFDNKASSVKRCPC